MKEFVTNRLGGGGGITRTNLTVQVYDILRDALLEGRLRPHQRLKIRDLATILDVSETPVREAVMQLVRERALALQTARSLTVPRPSVPTYLELRRIRIELEGLAAEQAATQFGRRELTKIERLNARLARAVSSRAWSDVVVLNWRFHAMIYQSAGMPELFNLIQGLWLRTSPLLSLLYPTAPPTYPGRNRHLDILDALRNHDGAAIRIALQADTIEGGANLLALLREIDAGRVDEATLSQQDDLARVLQRDRSLPQGDGPARTD